MEKQKATDSNEVSNFLATLEHSLKAEIERIRQVILKANKGVTEIIKWNAPSFCFENEDRITMRIHPPKQIELIFHRGAKVKEQPKEKLITEDAGMLSWKANDRAVATFTNMADIKAKEADLITIINSWLKATNR